ncbi:MAG TPA: FxLYD domain-containing protein [bacterium]|nr:FxLYD domain-containing protein [bacterium]
MVGSLYRRFYQNHLFVVVFLSFVIVFILVGCQTLSVKSKEDNREEIYNLIQNMPDKRFDITNLQWLRDEKNGNNLIVGSVTNLTDLPLKEVTLWLTLYDKMNQVVEKYFTVIGIVSPLLKNQPVYFQITVKASPSNQTFNFLNMRVEYLVDIDYQAKEYLPCQIIDQATIKALVEKYKKDPPPRPVKPKLTMTYSITDIEDPALRDKTMGILKRYTGGIRHCVEMVLRSKPDILPLHISLNVFLAQKGSVDHVDILESSGNEYIDGCVVRRTKRHRFPADLLPTNSMKISYDFQSSENNP